MNVSIDYYILLFQLPPPPEEINKSNKNLQLPPTPEEINKSNENLQLPPTPEEIPQQLGLNYKTLQIGKALVFLANDGFKYLRTRVNSTGTTVYLR